VNQVSEQSDRTGEHEDDSLRQSRDREHYEADRDRFDAITRADDGAIYKSVRVPVFAVSVRMAVVVPVRVIVFVMRVVVRLFDGLRTPREG
jgi:hypothetical protein